MRSQQGVALIIVLLIIAILSTIVVEMSYSARVDLNIAGNLRDRLKAACMARSGVQAAQALLKADQQMDTFFQQETDTVEEIWDLTEIIPFPATEEGGYFVIEITDEAGKININQLNSGNNDPELFLLSNLLYLEEFDLKPMQREQKLSANNFLDWIDEDDTTEGSVGFEDTLYNVLDDPYVSKDQAFDSIAEIALVSGVDDEVFNTIKEYVTIFTDGKINVNTAPLPVLQAIHPSIAQNPSLAVTIDAARINAPFDEKENSFKTYLEETLGIIPAENKEWYELLGFITTKSDVFSIRSTGYFNNTQVTIESVVKRPSNPQEEFQIYYWRED